MMRRDRSAAPGRPATAKTPVRRVTVWDLPTRLFHWLAAALVAAAWASWRLNWMDWHARIGEALLALVLWRILWGFCGSETARFARFLATPRAALQHLAHLFRREPDGAAGHNPAGGWMVLLLLALLLCETLTGIYVANDVADAGPLTPMTPAPVADLVTLLHALLWDALFAAICLHVLAVAVYAAVKGHNLVLPMLTGRKRLPEGVPSPRLAGPVRALVAFAAAAAAAALLALM